MARTPFTFVIADPHPIVRLGVVSVLKQLGGKALEAADGNEALRLTAKHRPHLAILEIFLERRGGFVVAHQIITGKGGTQVLMLTADTSDQQVERAARIGVHGYLGKNQPEPDKLLAQAVPALLQGGTWFDPGVADVMAQYASVPGYARKDKLTDREIEVFYLIVSSYSNREIAEELGMNIKTVGTHRTNLMLKLGESDAAGLTRYAARTGYLKVR